MYISEPSNHEEAARTLIEAGADLNCSYEDTTETLAMFAAAHASPNFVKFLVSRPNLFLDAQVAEPSIVVYSESECCIRMLNLRQYSKLGMHVMCLDRGDMMLLYSQVIVFMYNNYLTLGCKWRDCS